MLSASTSRPHLPSLSTNTRSLTRTTRLSMLGGGGRSASSVPIVIDLRSDTVTLPSAAMRKAMSQAEVGDDVYGEDPTINALEERTARLFKKESALYFPTGTMANLAATMSWCGTRGAEAILGDKCHLFQYEQGGMAQIAGVMPRTLPNRPDGTLDLDQLEKAIILKDDVHYAQTEMITLENTHNYCGGKVLPRGYLQAVSRIARNKGIPLHLDGARIWNAAVSSGLDVGEMVAGVDSISACLSKGLGAPAGSLLIGPAGFIHKARRVRKSLGGGMRQGGVLAAAGMVALDDFEKGLLAADHLRARTIAEAISKMPGFLLDVSTVQSNIVLVEMDPDHATSPSDVAGLLKEKGVLILPFGPNNIRLVTHRDITDQNVQDIIEAFKAVTLQLWPRPIAASPPNAATTPASDIVTNIETGIQFISPLSRGENVIDTDVLESKATNSANSSETFFEEVVIHGMCPSTEGFCVILRGLICDRYLRVLVTPSDPMSDGLDRERVETPEAVTLLQLLQGIDVETHLSKDVLLSKYMSEIKMQDPGTGKRYSQNAVSLYRALILDPCKFISVPSSKSDGAKCSPGLKPFLGMFIMRSLEPEGEISDVDSSSSRGPVIREIMKEVECKSAFENIGLAIRHNAIIEAQSSLLQDDEISYSEDELVEYFPNLVEANPDLRRGACDFYDVRCELNRLERLLKESDRQGNSLKSVILRQEISQLEGGNAETGPKLIDFPDTTASFEDQDKHSSAVSQSQ